MSKVIEAIQRIYPEIKGGFVYWETKYDGTPLDKPIDGLVWENTEFMKPTWKQIEAQFDICKLKESKINKINQLAKNRELKAEKSFVEYNGKTYSNSQNARNSIAGRIGLMTNSSSPRFFLTFPNKEGVFLVKSDFVAIANLIDEKESDLRQQEQNLITAINTCSTIEELDNININLD